MNGAAAERPEAATGTGGSPASRSGFRHLHAAHCETGVTAALFAHAGLDLSEPLVFGIGSGIFFLHLPFFKVMGVPLTSYRSYPMSIFRKVCGRLGATYHARRFRFPRKGREALDRILDQGTPVAVQANIYWLSYFPSALRFQFNGHNLIVTGRDGDEYAISDPVLESPVTCRREVLDRARFARGPLAPRGLLFHPMSVPEAPDLRRAVRRGVAESCRMMLRSPIPFAGVRGIRYLSRRLRNWPRAERDPRRAKLQLANLVRMQEEVGTGGAGFRFMYAAFLQEAAERLDHAPFAHASELMTATGDRWRRFAEGCALVCKDRGGDAVTYPALAEKLEEIAEREREVFAYLRANLPATR